MNRDGRGLGNDKDWKMGVILVISWDFLWILWDFMDFFLGFYNDSIGIY